MLLAAGGAAMILASQTVENTNRNRRKMIEALSAAERQGNIASPTPTETALPATPTPPISPTPTVTPTPTSNPTASPSPKPTSPPVSGPPGAGLSTITVATSKGNFRATVLAINLANTKIITDTGNDGECGSNCTVLPLATYVNRNGGFAGVNGSYFCPATYPDCASKSNSFDFPVYNTRLNRWINGGNLSWGSRSIFYTDGSGAHHLQGANSFSGSLNAGVVNNPGLLADGNVQIDDNQSGLADKQKIKNTKVGIGLRDNQNVMVVIAQNVNMQEFAYVFKSLGAKAALNLDTGGSAAMVYNGHYVFGPGRDIPNAIVFAKR